MPVTPIDPKERVYMDLKPALDIVFASDSPAAGEAVPAVLGGIYNYVIRDVLGALEPFLEPRTLLAPSASTERGHFPT